MLPVDPLLTVAVMLVAELTTKEVAGVPPNETAVAPVKLRPMIVTVFPWPVAVGENEVIAGAA